MNPEDVLKLKEDRRELLEVLSNALDYVRVRTTPKMELINAVSRIENDKDKHFLTFSQDDPKKVSYASKPEFMFDNKKRTKTSLGRYFRRRLKVNKKLCDDEALTTFTDEVFAMRSDGDENIDIVYGNAIVESFRRAIGGHSCMTEECAGLTQFYAANPQKIGLLIFRKTHARAVVWLSDNNEVLIDRIYPNDGGHIRAIIRWARKNGLKVREHQSAPSRNFIKFITPDENRDRREESVFERRRRDGNGQFVVTTQVRDDDRFPYLDTMCWGRFTDDRKLILTNKPGPGFNCRFHSTGGGYVRLCDVCGENDGFHHHSGVYRCCNCMREAGFIQCGSCGDWHDDESQLIHVYDYDRYYCQRCARDHARFCVMCERHFGGNARRFADTDEHFCEYCYYHNINTRNRCRHCGEFHRNEIPVSVEGRSICTRCGVECHGCSQWFRRDRFQRNIIELSGLCSPCHSEEYLDCVLEV
jgi:hypothetical protein